MLNYLYDVLNRHRCYLSDPKLGQDHADWQRPSVFHLSNRLDCIRETVADLPPYYRRQLLRWFYRRRLDHCLADRLRFLHS